MTIEEARVLLAVAAGVPTPNWLKWVFFVITAHAIYCLFDSDQRDRVYCDLYRFRGSKRTGAPVSIRTNVLVVFFWLYVSIVSFSPNAWNSKWYTDILFLGLMVGGMISSYFDVSPVSFVCMAISPDSN